MDMGQILELLFKYALAPLAAVIWYMFKKQESRIDVLEKRMTDSEKTLIEVRTEFRYIREDISSIKDMISKLADK